MIPALPVRCFYPAMVLCSVLSIAPHPAIADGVLPRAKELAPKARQLREKACEQGNSAACIALGDMHLGLYFAAGGGDTKDAELALALYEKACAANNIVGCRQVGWMLDDGLLVHDEDRAQKLFRQACDAGDGGGCTLLAGMLEKMPPAPPEPPLSSSDTVVATRRAERLLWIREQQKRIRAAMKLYEKACGGNLDGLGCLSGCGSLGDIYFWGSGGITTDRQKASIFYERACGAGCASHCDTLGTQYREGDGIPQNLARAATFYDKGCELGFPPSCAALGELYRQGGGVDKDAQKAQRLLEKACVLSHNQVEFCQKK